LNKVAENNNIEPINNPTSGHQRAILNQLFVHLIGNGMTV
ncbi:MAG: hypothetical protein RLZZ381_3921, partial [Cyanobacteriota bacterium]|jgi:hypothetical protein